MKIVVLTGAGISAESGIPTFRDSQGLWENHSVEDVATPEGYARDPKLVHDFYNARRAQAMERDSEGEFKIKPNAAHYALAELEAIMGKNFTIVTQNIDPLHERAGSKHVIHMHGAIDEVHCTSCDGVLYWNEDCHQDVECTICGEKTLRPNVVWFGETPFMLPQIDVLLTECDVFAAIGTSGAVYPAAGFAAYVMERNIESWEINLIKSEDMSYLYGEGVDGKPLRPHSFNKGIYGPASTTVPEWVKEMKGRLK